MYLAQIKNLQGEVGWKAEFELPIDAELWAEQQLARPNRLQEPMENIISDMTLIRGLEKEQIKAKKYLNDTDWYVIRYAEKGIEIPLDIKNERFTKVAILNGDLPFKLGIKEQGNNSPFKIEYFPTYDLAVQRGEEQKDIYGHNYEIDDLKLTQEWIDKYNKAKIKSGFPLIEEIAITLVKHLAGEQQDMAALLKKITDANKKGQL